VSLIPVWIGVCHMDTTKGFEEVCLDVPLDACQECDGKADTQLRDT
jgi:hypothetical protein